MSKDFEELVQDFYEVAVRAELKKEPAYPGPDADVRDWAEYWEQESRKKSLLRHVAEKYAKRDKGKEQKDNKEDRNKPTSGKQQGLKPQIQKQSWDTRTDVIESRKKEELQQYDEKRFRDPSSRIERSRLEGASDRELLSRLNEEPNEQLDERLNEQVRQVTGELGDYVEQLKGELSEYSRQLKEQIRALGKVK